MELLQTIVVPGYTGRAVPVDKGRIIRVTDIEGSQIADTFALNRDDTDEYLSTSHTRILTERLMPKVGQQFFTNYYQPVLTFLEDTSPGKHDTLVHSCDPKLFEMLGAGADHPNCHDNFLKAVQGIGLDISQVPGPVNLFQNTPVSADGTVKVERAMSKAGDYVSFRAEMDIYFVVAACSVDIKFDANNFKSTPVRIETFSDTT